MKGTTTKYPRKTHVTIEPKRDSKTKHLLKWSDLSLFEDKCEALPFVSFVATSSERGKE